LFHPNEIIPIAFVGASRFLGKGYWRIEYINWTDLALNFSSIFERNHVKLSS
jgi:hypothetical protein